MKQVNDLCKRVLIKIVVSIKGLMIEPNGLLCVPSLLYHYYSILNDITLNCNFAWFFSKLMYMCRVQFMFFKHCQENFSFRNLVMGE